MRMLLVAIAVAGVTFVAVTLVIRSGESEEARSVEEVLAERYHVKVTSCRETSSKVVFYRCKLETPFRYAEMKAFEDDWCVGPDGSLMVPIKTSSDARRCNGEPPSLNLGGTEPAGWLRHQPRHPY
jgi:hypothetical protein